MTGRAVFGRVYELVLRGQRDDEHTYVGKTEQTIHQRVHGGRNAHSSPQSVARDPWKAGILPGRAGWRQLEVVYDTGDPAENDRALRRAEAFWIDRLRPTKNDVRPVRPRVTVMPPATAMRRPSQRELNRLAARRRARRRTVGLLVLVALFTFAAARVAVQMQTPWPAFPWVAAPIAGVALGWATFGRLLRARKKLLG